MTRPPPDIEPIDLDSPRVDVWRRVTTKDISAGKRRAWFSGFLAGIMAGMVIGWADKAHSETITAPIRIIDGDTVEIMGRTPETIRILNIDAPETRLCAAEVTRSCAKCPEETALGAKARDHLASLLAGATVTIERCDGARCTDPYGRTLARIRANGRDVGEALITTSLATRWPQRFNGCGRRG